MKKLFVFDLDDTLMDNVHDYAEPILQSCRVIIEELKSAAPHVSVIVALEEEIDLARRSQVNPNTGKTYGYSMERFPGSLAETYRQICARAGVDVKNSTERALYNIGLGAFSGKSYANNIKPDASEVINFIKSQWGSVVIYTAGDSTVQSRKIEVLRQVGRISFDDVRIVDKKSQSDFESLKESVVVRHRCSSFYSIGNNYKSDIVPALEAGYRGIYIPVETWETIGKMDGILDEVNQERCLVFHSLAEIKEKYSELK